MTKPITKPMPSAISSDSDARWVLALTSAASFMVALDALVVATALSTMKTAFGASLEQLEWIVNAYGLTLAVLLISGAALGDRFGRRRMFAIGLALFTLSSIACALSTSAAALIASRAVQGAAAALVMPLAMALLSVAFPAERRAKALGIFGGVTGLAVLSGPVIGGLVVQGLAWPWIFWVNVPIGIVLIALVLRRIPESVGSDARFDLVGIGLITTAALGITWALMRGNHAGWTSAEALAPITAGLILLAAFIGWSLRAAAPMVPMRLFQNRAFAAGNIANFCLNASLYSTLFFLAQFLQTAQQHGPLAAGLRMLPWTGTLFIVAPIAGSLVSKTGERPLIALGLLLQAFGIGWLALIARPDLPFAPMIAPLVAAGCGLSMAIPAIQSAVLGSVGKNELGKASGVLNMLRMLGGVFGIAVIGAVFAATGSIASATAFSSGFTIAMLGSAGFALLGALSGLALPMRGNVSAAKPAQQKLGEA